MQTDNSLEAQGIQDSINNKLRTNDSMYDPSQALMLGESAFKNSMLQAWDTPARSDILSGALRSAPASIAEEEDYDTLLQKIELDAR